MCRLSTETTLIRGYATLRALIECARDEMHGEVTMPNSGSAKADTET
jgi:hypothetical protein